MDAFCLRPYDDYFIGFNNFVNKKCLAGLARHCGDPRSESFLEITYDFLPCHNFSMINSEFCVGCEFVRIQGYWQFVLVNQVDNLLVIIITWTIHKSNPRIFLLSSTHDKTLGRMSTEIITPNCLIKNPLRGIFDFISSQLFVYGQYVCLNISLNVEISDPYRLACRK